MEFFSPGHLIVLAIVVAVLFFGWKQLPDMARSLGRSLRIFKTEIKGMSEDDRKRAEAREAAGSQPATPVVPPAVEAPNQPPVPQVPAQSAPQPLPQQDAEVNGAAVRKPFE
ncbi:MAG TPA: Sec-independent protein translocase subunit TatA [Jatrophihabitans sp.]|jgi:sec-independent protein translocase protein TatA